jgi:drug/metabolite transporter (DMT)-like permease
VAVTGVVVMVSGSYAGGSVAGDLLAIAMATSFAVATVLVRRHPDIPMAPAAALSTAITALIALPFATPFTVDGVDVVLLAMFGVLQFGTGFLLFMAGARLLPVAQTSLIGMLETVLGPLWVWAVLDERPGATALLGGGLILTALVLNTAVEVVRPRRGVVRDARFGEV